MDWTLALERNQTILLRHVAWLFAWLTLEVGGSVETVPRHKRLTVFLVLRPSEAAYRRVVYIAMYVRGVVAPVFKARVKSEAPKKKIVAEKPAGTRPLPFKLIDPRKRFDLFPDRPKYVKGPGPRVTDMWSDDPIFDRSDLYAYQERMKRPPPTPDDEISAKALCRRMNSLMAALQDLDGQVLCMAKLHGRMKWVQEQTGKRPLQTLRPGYPPGHRQRHRHAVDEILKETHQLALDAQQEFPPP